MKASQSNLSRLIAWLESKSYFLFMWFKHNPSESLRRWPYRSLEQYGSFLVLCHLAWDNEGLPDDLKRVSQLSGLPIENLDLAWEHFKAQSAEFKGKLMPVEMIEGHSAYAKSRQHARTMADARWKKGFTESKEVADTTCMQQAYSKQCSLDTASNASCNADLDLDKEKEKAAAARTHAHEAKTIPKQKTAAAASSLTAYREEIKAKVVTITHADQIPDSESLVDKIVKTLLEKGATVEELELFAQSRKSIKLSYCLQDFGQFRLDQSRETITGSSSSPAPALSINFNGYNQHQIDFYFQYKEKLRPEDLKLPIKTQMMLVKKAAAGCVQCLDPDNPAGVGYLYDATELSKPPIARKAKPCACMRKVEANFNAKGHHD